MHDRLKRFIRNYRWQIIVLAVILIGAAAGGWWLAQRKQEISSGDVEVRAIVQKVQKHMLLPGDESPGLVTVVDKSKIVDIPFLQHSAENGDKLLVYTKARKAILYRPSIDRVVDVGPVSIADLSGESKQ